MPNAKSPLPQIKGLEFFDTLIYPDQYLHCPEPSVRCANHHASSFEQRTQGPPAPARIYYTCAALFTVALDFNSEQRRVILFSHGKDKRETACAGHKQLRSQREHRLTGGIG
jgi:hypothetical protein